MINVKKIKSYLISFILISVMFIGFGIGSANAQDPITGTNEVSSSTKLDNPLGPKMTDPNIVIGKIINSVLGIVGTIALAMFIYGGFRWMTSGGGDGVKAGKETIVWATLGLIVIFMAYAAVKFILGDVLFQGPPPTP